MRRKIPQNISESLKAALVEETFGKPGRMGWESFVRTRLPLFSLSEDLRDALERGIIPCTATLELRKVRGKKKRRKLLKKAVHFYLRELKERVRVFLRKEAVLRPWHKTVSNWLARLNPEALPKNKRVRAEATLRELKGFLEGDI